MGTAKVDSVDSLRALRNTLCKFAEGANTALADAEGEMQRMLVWLELEQHTYWQAQIRTRTEAVSKAADALRHKKIYKDAVGFRPSTVDEEKALAVAKRKLAEAEEKLLNVRKYIPRLQKEIQSYKGSVQRFATTVQSDIPRAVGQLGNMVAALENYAALALNAPEAAAAPIVDSAPVAASVPPADSSTKQP